MAAISVKTMTFVAMESGGLTMNNRKKLVELPCEVGTQVWLTEWWDHSHLRWTKQNTPLPRHIHHFDIAEDGVFAHFNDGCINVKYFSEIVFFTKEEAKAHLKENNNGHS